MNLEKRIDCFARLGYALDDKTYDEISHLAYQAQAQNAWFSIGKVWVAYSGIRRYLHKDKLISWLQRYDIDGVTPKTVAVIMAGNIPFVGVHDLICVLLAGHKMQIKLSAKDTVLMKEIIRQLVYTNEEWEKQIEIVETIKNFDAVIATGSNNTARHFEYYFSKYPHIIRQSRTSVAVLHGNETQEELAGLGEDVLQYFGMGCRNVSKVYVPTDFDLTVLCGALLSQENVANNNKYKNNYDYNKAIYLVEQIEHYDTGFLLLTENKQLFSPTSVLYYERYASQEDLQQKIDVLSQSLQCITSSQSWFPNSIDLGKAQQPEIYDYADGVDTMQFLTKGIFEKK